MNDTQIDEKIKVGSGRREVEITKRAFQLLQDLAELEDAGLISRAESIYAEAGYDEGSLQVDIPATVTDLGRIALREHAETTASIAPNAT